MKVEYLHPDELIPYPGNAKTHPPEQVKHIANSIKAFGWQQPIVVDKDNVVIIGHGRLAAAKQLMLDTVPVVYADNLTEDQVDALRLADNKTNESEWDFGKLEEELAALDIAGFDMAQFGFDDLSAIGGATSEITEDEPPEVPEEPKAKRGEIYRLGNHRLMCGDSTNREDVAALMDGKKANMIFTDPPYGVNYEGGVIHGNKINTEHKREKLKNDDIDIYSGFICLIDSVIEDGAIYIFYATRNSYELFKALKENGVEVHSIIVWNKINTGYADMNSHYKNKYEPCVYACKKGRSLNWHGGTSECTVWDINKDRDNKLHPTQKPIELPSRAIMNSSKNGEIVLDLFGGSGSTLIACEQTGRKCYMMELDPHYVDVIIQRWENLTGQKAELIKGAD